MPLPDRQACLDWISGHQRNRRNLSNNGISYSRGKHYLAERLASGRPTGSVRGPAAAGVGQTDSAASAAGPRTLRTPARAKRGQNDHLLLSGKDGQNDHLVVEWDGSGLKTAERLGSFYGCGERTIRRDKDFAEAVDVLADSCGEIAGELVLPAGARLHRTDVRRLLKLAPDEQCRLLALVREHGRPCLPWFRRQNASFSVPRNPARIAQIILSRLGKMDALLVRDGLTSLVQAG